MKYFLYLNNDIVNSIISQSEQGLISKFISESQNGDKEEFSKKTQVGALAKLSSKFYKFIEAEVDFNAESGRSNSISNYKESKDIVQKTLHDAAYNIAYKNIESNIEKELSDLGMYVEISDTFQYIDFNLLVSYLDKDGIIKYVKENEEKELTDKLSNETNQMNRADRRANESIIKNTTKKIKAEINKKYAELIDMIKSLKAILPYDRMYISNKGCIIPIDDQYLRDNPNSFGFKYGGNMTCVGYVTNIIGKDTFIDDGTNYFESMQHAISEALRMILPLKDDNIYIVNPIAIYYSNNIIPDNKIDNVKKD